MGTSNWIALGVGGYAAVVATSALVWNILRERHNVTVKIRYARSFGLPTTDRNMVAIEVINNGRHPINIQEIGFLLADKTKLVNLKTQQKLGWLKDGDGTTYYIPKQEIEEMAKE